MKNFIRIICGASLTLHILTVAFICLSTSAADKEKKNDGKKEQAKEYGQAVFPAEGRIKMDEGTVEAWLALDYSAKDMMLQDESIITPMTFFSLIEKERLIRAEEKDKKDGGGKDDYSGNEAEMNLKTQQGRALSNSIKYHCNLFRLERGKTVVKGVTMGLDEVEWKEKEWYFIAIAWKKTETGYDAYMYINGKKKEQSFDKEETVKFPKTMKEHLISIGSFRNAKGSVEALRISGKFKTDVELEADMKAGLAKDDSTLFLFDSSLISAMKKARQADLGKNTQVTDKGLFIGPYKTIAGKHGKAVQFHE